MTIFEICILIWLFILSLAAFLNSRFIGYLLIRLSPTGARFENDGPRIGENIGSKIQDGGLSNIRPIDKKNILVFKSKSCAVCKFINPENIAYLAKFWSNNYRFIVISDDADDYGENVSKFDSPLRNLININYVPFAITLDENFNVTNKALINNMGNIESILESA